jgi:hypothetical protein
MDSDVATPLQQLRRLIWIQSAVGAAIAGAIFFFAMVLPAEPYAVGLMVAGVFWLFGFRGLRRRAALLGGEHPEAPPIHPKILAALALVELLAPASSLTGRWGALIVPANLLAGATIALYVLTCNGLDLPVHRRSWGVVFFSLALGTVWNIVGTVVLFSLFGGF